MRCLRVSLSCGCSLVPRAPRSSEHFSPLACSCFPVHHVTRSASPQTCASSEAGVRSSRVRVNECTGHAAACPPVPLLMRNRTEFRLSLCRFVLQAVYSPAGLAAVEPQKGMPSHRSSQSTCVDVQSRNPTPAHTDAVPHSCAHALRPLRWQRLRLRAPMAPSATLRSLSCAACGGADLGCHVLSVAPERAVPLDVAWSPQPASIGQSVARRQEREKERAVCVRRLGLGCSGCTESSGSMARARRRL
jgi:hypothetical protein